MEEIFYKCDYEKRNDCAKDICQDLCFFTKNSNYSVDGKRYVYDDDIGDFKNLDS